MRAIIFKLFILFLTLAFKALQINAQDGPLSQFYNDLTFINPAYVGTTDGIRVNTFYRNQWPRADANFVSYGVSYDQTIKKYKSGFGIQVMNDENGAVKSPTIKGTYAYHFEALPGLLLSMALQGGITQKYVLASELIFQDAIDNGSTNEQLYTGFNKLYADFAVGIVGFYKKGFAGLSLDHITKPKTDQSGTKESGLNRKLTLQLGYIFEINKRNRKKTRAIIPNVLIQMQGGQSQLTWGSLLQYDYIIGGLFVRHNISLDFDVLIFSAGIKTKKSRLAYSYDMNIGKNTVMPLGAHEISLTFLTDFHIKKKYKSLSCPTFLK